MEGVYGGHKIYTMWYRAEIEVVRPFVVRRDTGGAVIPRSNEEYKSIVAKLGKYGGGKAFLSGYVFRKEGEISFYFTENGWIAGSQVL